MTTQCQRRTARAPRGRNELECRSRRPAIRKEPTLFGGKFLEGLDSSLYYSTGAAGGCFVTSERFFHAPARGGRGARRDSVSRRSKSHETQARSPRVRSVSVIPPQSPVREPRRRLLASRVSRFLVQHIDLLELSRGPATFQKTLPVPFVFLTGYGRTSMSFTTF